MSPTMNTKTRWLSIMSGYIALENAFYFRRRPTVNLVFFGTWFITDDIATLELVGLEISSKKLYMKLLKSVIYITNYW